MFKIKKTTIAVFHEFHRPPYGGGNQFLLALCKEFKKRGLRIEYNKISIRSRACLFNSFNFDFKLLRDSHRPGCVMVHRVDGPVGVYRGWDDGTDQKIWQINREIADVTVFQSQYSLNKHLEMGFEFKYPHIIMNAADPRIFNQRGRVIFGRDRKIRLISISWSDNPNKGADIYKWLDDNLDYGRFEYTFIGRSQVKFSHIGMLAPMESRKLARLLRQHDIYIIASRNDPCSNALIEALSCGLPAIYLKSGGHPEITGQAGFDFSFKEEIPHLLVRLIEDYGRRQSLISLPNISEIAICYLEVMGLA